MNEASQRRWSIRAAMYAALFISLFLGQLQSYYFLLPDWLGLVCQGWHSLSFWACLPGLILSRKLAIGHPADWVLSAALTTIVLFGLTSLTRYIRSKGKKEQEGKNDNNRRLFLKRSFETVTLALLTGGWAYASLLEPNLIRIKRRDIRIQDLPDSLEGLRVIHLTDTHYGPYVPLHHLERAIRELNDLHPDLVILTGDYVHKTPRSIHDGIGVFQGLRSRCGTVAVLGNHDHWEGTDACKRRFEEIGIPLIDNDRLFLSNEGLSEDIQLEAICIGGVGDLWEDKVLFTQALEGVPEEMPRLVLAHNPDCAEEVPTGMRIDMMFSGHTHGGQIVIPGLPTMAPSYYGEKYLRGLCQGPSCPVLVSPGIGMTVLPARFRVVPEVSVYTLKKG